jgi:hypothetical protein
MCFGSDSIRPPDTAGMSEASRADPLNRALAFRLAVSSN